MNNPTRKKPDVIGKEKKILCPACDGDSFVTIDGNEIKCSECNGTGYLTAIVVKQGA